MELMKWKTTLAVLWIAQAANFAAVVFYGFFELTDTPKFAITLCLFYPCLMAWLAIALKGSVNRWLSFILGILTAIEKLRFLIAGLAPAGMAFRFNEYGDC